MIFSFSLADISLDEDLFSTESLSTDSNIYFNDDWQDSGTSTLPLNDVVDAADTDLLFASACGGENGNLNKLRRRGGGIDSFCLNGQVPQKEKEGVIVPEIFQPGDPVLDRIDSTTKSGSKKCV